MAETQNPDLCPDCERRKKEEESARIKQEGKKDDRFEAIRRALNKAEKCRHFCHHTLFDANAKEDPLMGSRTCSLLWKAKCGHEVLKHGLCMDWIDGKDCPDWEERE